MVVAATTMLHRLRETSILIDNGISCSMANFMGRNAASTTLPLNYGHSLPPRGTKRRRLLNSCDLNRGVGTGGFLDTCRHCGRQIVRKAQSRPRICLQCEKKRATPIHDRCKDCREPIVRSNVRKARICQKCKKSREKPNPSPQGISSDSNIVTAVANATCDGRYGAHSLLNGYLFPTAHRFPPHFSSRRIYAINQWFHMMSQQHQLLAHYHQQQQQMVSPSMMLSPSAPGSFMYPTPQLNTRQTSASYCSSSLYPTESLQAPNTFSSDVFSVHNHFLHASHNVSNPLSCSRDVPPYSHLPKVKTEHFQGPEDIVAYLKDRVLKKLSSATMPSPATSAIKRSPARSTPPATSRRSRTSAAPILVPQVNPYMIRECSTIKTNGNSQLNTSVTSNNAFHSVKQQNTSDNNNCSLNQNFAAPDPPSLVDDGSVTPKRATAGLNTEKALETTVATPEIKMRLKSDIVLPHSFPVSFFNGDTRKWPLSLPETSCDSGKHEPLTAAAVLLEKTALTRNPKGTERELQRSKFFNAVKDEQQEFRWAETTPSGACDNLNGYMSPLGSRESNHSGFILQSSVTPPHLETETTTLAPETPLHDTSLLSSDRVKTLKLLLYPRDLPSSSHPFSPVTSAFEERSSDATPRPSLSPESLR